jgi:hypothetical protein
MKGNPKKKWGWVGFVCDEGDLRNFQLESLLFDVEGFDMRVCCD